MNWTRSAAQTPTGRREIWRCPQRRVNYPDQRCPFTVQVAEPWRQQQQAAAEQARLDHETTWHGAASWELLRRVNEAVLAVAEKVVRGA